MGKKVLAFVFALMYGCSHTTAAETSCTVENIHVAFYYHESGRLGGKNLLDPGVVLRNSIIGEGDADEPSSTLLVSVSLEKPASSPTCTGELRLLAIQSEAGRVLKDETVELESLLAEGTTQFTVPSLVRDIGCHGIVLEATLTPHEQTPSIRRVLPFSCGE